MLSFLRTAARSVYLPIIDKAEDAYAAFAASGRALFLFFSALLIVSSGALIFMLNGALLVSTPASGGSFTEGILGAPRFINPVLAVSSADNDLSVLIYSGLLKTTPEGEYVPNLASSFELSDGGRVYTFYLREDATFHDGTVVSAHDVTFTVAKIQDPSLKSPIRANWEGVTVEALDDRTVRFTLVQPYAPFINNATVGILPKHLWSQVSVEEFPFSELNTSPIGSGPFQVKSVSRTASGIPSSYELRPFDDYTLGRPYLSSMRFNFYQNEEELIAALARGDIEAVSSVSPSLLPELPYNHTERSALNRVFGIFFNQNEAAVLRDLDVRVALEMAVDREALVANILGGYGTALSGPVPPGVVVQSAAKPAAAAEDRALAAREHLLSDGWETSEDGTLFKTTGSDEDEKTLQLSFTISTGNVAELRAAAEFVKEAWERMGAKIEIQVFDQGDLSQNVIRPRKYEALLFGEVVGRELDLFAFWDSSQRNDPGLNIALYANATADRLLKALRETSDEEVRASLYAEFEAELRKDIPAVFLYAPDFVYSIPNDIKGFELGFIETSSDRFLSVREWHREVDYVWPVFLPDTTI